MRNAHLIGAPVARALKTGRLFVATAALALAGTALSAPAYAETPNARADATVSVDASVDAFYAARANRPLWTAQPGAVEALVAQLESASLDGLDPNSFDGDKIAKRLAKAENDADRLKADRALTEAFVNYARALRKVDARKAGWEINDPEAVQALRPDALLSMLATAGDLKTFVRDLPFMNATYAGLRQALVAADASGDERNAKLIRANMERARLLPGRDVERYVLVNAAEQRLYMMERGRVVGSMKVVVGKPDMATPMMAAMIRHTVVNPYWNLPTDLVAERVAPNVLKEGQAYLDKKGYRILSDWSDQAATVSPASIDWNAVADGKVQLRMRQDPGKLNAMGSMKFMFPNPHGVYLHDTPQKELMGQDSRMFSAGCVRLEKAAALAQWLYGRSLNTRVDEAEKQIALDRAVPVYLGYFTVVPKAGGSIAYLADPYNRDGMRMASLASR